MRTIPMAFAALALALASCSLRGASEISLIGSNGPSPDANAGHDACGGGSGYSPDGGLDYDAGGYYGNDGGGYYGNDAGIYYGNDGGWEDLDAGIESLDAGSGHHHPGSGG